MEFVPFVFAIETEKEKALEAMNADSSVNQLKARSEGFERDDVPWPQINFL